MKLTEQSFYDPSAKAMRKVNQAAAKEQMRILEVCHEIDLEMLQAGVNLHEQLNKPDLNREQYDLLLLGEKSPKFGTHAHKKKPGKD